MFTKLPQNIDEFYTQVLGTSITALKFNTFSDNFDESITPKNIGTNQLTDFNINDRVFYFHWFYNNYSSLFNAYKNLCNDDSKVLYLYLIAYRLAGKLSIRLPLDWSNDGGLMKYKEIEGTPQNSPLNINGMFGNLKHYDFKFNGCRYQIDCVGLEYYLFRKQYFYSVDGITVAPSEGDYVIDGGACFGDTALVFSNSVGENGHVFAFDPVAEHQEILNYNLNQFSFKNVTAIPFGLSDHDVLCSPLVLNTYNPAFRSSSNNVPLISIDSFVSKYSINKIDFIKLDIEGAELEAIVGAKESIDRFKPKLAISLYHKPNDLFELITHINNQFPFYKLYLNHYTVHQGETVLYCSI